MLTTPVFISNSDGPFSGNQYILNLTFQDATRAQFLNTGDHLQDSAGNIYDIVSLTLPFTNTGLVTVQYVNNNTLPVVDTTVYGSVAYTPGERSYAPPYQALGTINSSTLCYAPYYIWTVDATFSTPGLLTQVQIGDQILDSIGNIFSVEYIDPVLGFANMRVAEIIRVGYPPSDGACSVARGSYPNGFFQGLSPNSQALLVAQERDIARIDSLISATGPQGTTGVAGITGLPGPTGLTGAIGFTGTQGVQGVTGPVGVDGTTGRTGAVGVTGIQGLVGLVGNRGQQGATGFGGDQGATGAQGIRGVTGVGIRGIQGYQGNPGATGLQGAAGGPGHTGLQGEQGYTGNTGLRGPIGNVGFTGPQGLQGPSGPQGTTGIRGTTGPRGTTGVQGGTGIVGATGVVGPTGTANLPKKEKVLLQGSDITNQYIDLSELVITDSLFFIFDGLVQDEGTDYVLSVNGFGHTRVTFLGDLATDGYSELTVGDVVSSQYLYAP